MIEKCVIYQYEERKTNLEKEVKLKFVNELNRLV